MHYTAIEQCSRSLRLHILHKRRALSSMASVDGPGFEDQKMDVEVTA